MIHFAEPVDIRFSYLENALLELLWAEIMRNFCFHIEYSLSDLSISYGPKEPSQHSNTKSSILFWETTVYLKWIDKGMGHDTSFHQNSLK